MAENSEISWTHHTFNPWRGCTKVSPGCANCYAETMSKRNPSVLGVWGDQGTRVIAAPAYWEQPRKWDREAKAAGVRKRVFCASLADVFEDWAGPVHAVNGNPLWWCHGSLSNSPIPSVGLERGCRLATLDDLRARLFEVIEGTENLDWLLLTKRPQNVLRMTYYAWCKPVPGHVSQNSGDGRHWHWPPNVWLGVTVEDQARADERVPLLLQVPAKVRFLSCEPLLGPVSLFGCPPLPSEDFVALQRGHPSEIDWVIAGGESGHHARPMHPDWARSLRDQCQAAGVAFHFKQHGEWFPTEMFDYDTGRPRLTGRPEVYIGPAGEIVRTASPFEHGCPCDVPRDYESMVRVGKAEAGRLLDGREWDESPARKVAGGAP